MGDMSVFILGGNMCGILVGEQKSKVLRESVKELIKRGPDQVEEYSVKDSLFMFTRLSIMDLSTNGMQPFVKGEDVLVCNGEIYNYKQLKSEVTHDFVSESDCEVLLPLYQSLGTDMFKKLDAEFALVLYDSKRDQLIAGRDPVGIRPLFYGYTTEGSIAFGSEVKSLIKVVEKVLPFPPGHYYDGEFHQYATHLDVDFVIGDMDKAVQGIHDLLVDGIVKRLDSDANVGYLLSGGLDSSLVCSVGQRHSKTPIKTFSIGMEHDAIDIKYAELVAYYLGTDHTSVIISKDDVLEALDEVIYSLETFDITTIRASIGMYLICKYIRENTDIKVLMTGEVSDELFGYKYTDFAPDKESFQAECDKRLKELYMYDVLRADRCLASNSLEARVPFGDLAFVKHVMSIDPALKMNTYDMGKYLLRKAFEGDYLPDEILYRDKAAFSDAVGHSLVDYLIEFAEDKYSDAEFKQKVATYEDVVPFTKESLLYMEIFQKYYPDHQHLVVDYWMPNKEWVGSEVKDPSARVLSNYGKSGE